MYLYFECFFMSFSLNLDKTCIIIIIIIIIIIFFIIIIIRCIDLKWTYLVLSISSDCRWYNLVVSEMRLTTFVD